MIGDRVSGARRALPLLAAIAAAIMTVLPIVGAPTAAAEACPDVQVVYARGTFEPAGVGVTGQEFVDSLRGKLQGKSVDVYGVNYPASLDFARAADGVSDASAKALRIRPAPIRPVSSRLGGSLRNLPRNDWSAL